MCPYQEEHDSRPIEEIPVENPMQLSTEIHAKFITLYEPDPQTQTKLNRLNQYAEEICETLQPIFRRLIIEMLELKRQTLIR